MKFLTTTILALFSLIQLSKSSCECELSDDQNSLNLEIAINETKACLEEKSTLIKIMSTLTSSMQQSPQTSTSAPPFNINSPKPTTNYYCGQLLNLKNNDPSDPLTPGFPSGSFLDGSTVFPGTALFSNNYGANRVVRISTSESGGYSTHGSTLIFSSNANYFTFHPNLKWVSTNIPSASNVPGVIKVYPRTNNVLYPARKYFGTYYQIGYHWVEGKGAYFWNPSSNMLNTVKNHAENYEVLACSS